MKAVVRDVMAARPVWVERAVRLMRGRKVKRLPVVDAGGRLVGIVSRTDVLAVFDRADKEIRAEIMSQVISGRSEPSQYSVIYPVPLIPSRPGPYF